MDYDLLDAIVDKHVRAAMLRVLPAEPVTAVEHNFRERLLGDLLHGPFAVTASKHRSDAQHISGYPEASRGSVGDPLCVGRERTRSWCGDDAIVEALVEDVVIGPTELATIMPDAGSLAEDSDLDLIMGDLAGIRRELSMWLTSNQTVYPELLASDEPAPAVGDFRRLPDLAFHSVHDRFVAGVGPPAESLDVVTPSAPDPGGDFRSMPSAAWSVIHGRFPGARHTVLKGKLISRLSLPSAVNDADLAAAGPIDAEREVDQLGQAVASTADVLEHMGEEVRKVTVTRMLRSAVDGEGFPASNSLLDRVCNAVDVRELLRAIALGGIARICVEIDMAARSPSENELVADIRLALQQPTSLNELASQGLARRYNDIWHDGVRQNNGAWSIFLESIPGVSVGLVDGKRSPMSRVSFVPPSH